MFEDTSVSLGTAVVYANAYSDWPKNGGTAYSLEKSATFKITTKTASTSMSQNVHPTSADGTYNLTFKLPHILGKLGSYTTYVSASYQAQRATNFIIFKAIVIGDLNGDLKVDMRDIGMVARNFGFTAA